jgi:Phage integrase family
LVHNLEISSAFVTVQLVRGNRANRGPGGGGSLDAPRSLPSVQEREDFEQELVDQFLLAAVAAGMGDASERHDPATGWCCRVQDQAPRDGLAHAVERSLPTWSGRLTPHTLRHFCASSLYARGMDLKAIQELFGHEWLSTTTRYIHVHADHIERAWMNANNRIAARLGEGTG